MVNVLKAGSATLGRSAVSECFYSMSKFSV